MNEGVGLDWEAGMVRTLTGECMASLADHGVCVGCWKPAVAAPAGCLLCTGRECWGDVWLLLLLSLRTVLTVYCMYE